MSLYNETELAMLKVDLGLPSPAAAVSTYMGQLLDAAIEAITGKGITLDHASPGDMQLTVMYAAWLYRKRDSGGGQPDMLRYALRNRQVAEVTEVTDDI